jgi:hypothetical protein
MTYAAANCRSSSLASPNLAPKLAIQGVFFSTSDSAQEFASLPGSCTNWQRTQMLWQDSPQSSQGAVGQEELGKSS